MDKIKSLIITVLVVFASVFAHAEEDNFCIKGKWTSNTEESGYSFDFKSGNILLIENGDLIDTVYYQYSDLGLHYNEQILENLIVVDSIGLLSNNFSNYPIFVFS